MKKVCPKGGCIFPFTQNDNFGQLWTTLDKRRLIQGFRPPPPSWVNYILQYIDIDIAAVVRATFCFHRTSG